MQTLHRIYQTFLEQAHLKSCPVFRDNDFIGILFKKDLEQHLKSSNNDISEIIVPVSMEHLEEFLFYDTPNFKSKIPYLSPSGKVTGHLLYDEFVSEFFPEDFVTKLSLSEVFDYCEYPILILNQFKTIIYINNFAKDLLSERIFGIKAVDALISFEIDSYKGSTILKRQGEQWKLMISESKTPFASYYIYQMMPADI